MSPIPRVLILLKSIQPRWPLQSPLWTHPCLLNYKSAEAEASVILKIHHCIGDCISVMSLFLDCTRKNCQPESMPTIPRTNRYNRSNLPIWNVTGILKAIWGVMFVVWCTVLDLVQFMATFLWIKYSKMLRGPPGVNHHPKALAHVTLDLQDVAIVRKATERLLTCSSYLLLKSFWY